MTLREKIGKCAIWKAAIVLLLIFTFLIVGIEEVFVSRVFNVFNRMLVYFEKEKKQDADEWEKERKETAEFHQKSQKDFDELWEKEDKWDKERKIRKLCTLYLEIKSAREYLDQHKNDPANKGLEAWNKKQEEELKHAKKSQDLIDLENAIKNKELDPSTCKEDMA
jgi:hypothetical protein